MNPMQMLNNMYGGNPLFQRAMQMAKGKDVDGMKQIAHNLCDNMGIDFDEAYRQFEVQKGQIYKQMQMFGRNGINR